MEKNNDQFESGHPDFKSPANSGFEKKKLGALGALENSGLFGFSGEKLKSKTDEMIKSVVIRDCNSDLSKRWYVEYKEFNPDRSVWERKREYGYVNKEKDLQARRSKIEELYKEIITSLGNRFQSEKKGQNSIQQRIIYYLEDKKGSLKSIKNQTIALKYFYAFLQSNSLEELGLHQVTKQHIHEFKVAMKKITGPRSVNNHLDFVSSFFNYYINNFDDIVYKNPCRSIDRDPSRSETHVAYTENQSREFFNVMEQNDVQLYLYCKCISQGFIRCNEARQLRISDIDFIKRTITLPAYRIKNGERVEKPLLDVFYDLLISLNLHSYPGHYYLFSVIGKPGVDPVGKNYFRKRYKKLIKEAYRLDSKYTIYGYRHTSVSKLLANPIPWTEIMKYTGHKDMKSFSKYAESVFKKPAEDLSRYMDERYATNLLPEKLIF
jgi:integrase